MDDFEDDKVYPIVDLFPYKIKNRELFYDRDHPKDLNPNSSTYNKYYGSQLKKVIEGKWVNDMGTWVYMYPKLYHYVNFVKLTTVGKLIHPWLTDNEWIIFTYLTIIDGFSGFEKETEYTCYYPIKEIEDGKELDRVQLSKIPESAKKPNGGFKKFIYPWEYLTRVILVDRPGKPLGRALYENRPLNGLILTARSIGKDQRWDTKVYKEDGPCLISEVEVGDYIYGADGKLTRVLDKANYNNQLQYKVTFSDGRTSYCGPGHLWRVKRAGGTGEYQNMQLIDIYKNYLGYERKLKSGELKRDLKYYIPLAEPVQYPERQLPIDPYWLGLWLGDGSSKNTAITTMDDEIRDHIYEIGRVRGLKVRVENRTDQGKAKTYHLTIGQKGRADNNLLSDLRKLGLINNKYIPDEYLYSSEFQRMELLKGLMDSDGYCGGNGSMEIVQKNVRIADGICILLASLGIKHNRSEKVLNFFQQKKLEKPLVYQRIHIISGKVIFKLPRKIKNVVQETSFKRTTTKRLTVGISKIEPTVVDRSVCLKVDNADSLYLSDNYVVTHNSVSVFVGDFTHEFLFPNVRKMEDLAGINSRWNFIMGAGSSKPLKRSVSAISSFYSNMAGSYKYPPETNKPPCSGAFYKRIQGSWEVGKEITHITKDKGNRVEIQGCNLQMVALTPDKLNVASGDRFRRIYVEEAGFLEYIKKFYGAIKDSLQAQGVPVGSFIGTGTGGEMVAVRGSKEIFTNIAAYNLASIPNYWSNNKSARIGLFIPADYAKLDYKDPNGNTLLEEVRANILTERDIKRAQSQQVYDRDVQFNPLDPNDMLRPSGKSWLPRQESAKALARIEEFELFQRASIGTLTPDSSETYGVRFVPDLNNTLNPVIELRDDDSIESDKKGALIVYEHPLDKIPEGLYYVLYDPAAKSGDGESYHSVIVYKAANISRTRSLSDGIAAEWLGRLQELDDNYKKVVRIAKYFNATIFPERNVTGFIEYMNRDTVNLYHMLEPSALEIEREISPNSKSAYHPVGFAMQTKYKAWALKRLKSWLLRSANMDDGVVVERVIDTIHSIRIHNEIIAFNLTDNFDHISSLLGLQFLLAKLDGFEPIEEDMNQELEEYAKLQRLNMLELNSTEPVKPTFLNY